MSSRRIDLGLASPIRLGALVLDPVARTITRDDGARDVVEPRVMQVFLLLAEQRGEIVRRSELIERCWDGLSVGEDAINRVVSRLRRLSEGIGQDSFRIETIPRIGYRLVCRDVPNGSDDLPTPIERPSRRRQQIAIGAAATAGVAVIAILAATHSNDRTSRIAAASASAARKTATKGELPSNPAAASLLLQARDDWAQRTSESLRRSIGEFERVTKLAPDFAPGFAGLADAYLLAGEAGSLPDDVAFDGAENAAEHALKLDPNLGDAHRAIGFILYWQKHDMAGAGRAFREAIRLAPDSAQSHFWYANVLADAGQDAPATREFERARLIDPGSDQIAADYAWAIWIHGSDKEARARLEDIVGKFPHNAEAQACLSTIDLATADYRGFLQTARELAKLRREPFFETRVEELQAAYDKGGARAMLHAALVIEMRRQQDGPYPDHSAAAFYASLAGDRAALLEALAAADSAGEHWGASGYVRRIAAAWKSDPAIGEALGRRSSPLVEPASSMS